MLFEIELRLRACNEAYNHSLYSCCRFWQH